MHIVDRRLNPSGKNLANRQRFMRRAKSLIRKAVHETSGSRSIKDADLEGEVSLPAQGVHEPSLRRAGSGGIRDHLLPGNKEYIEGDTIPRPHGGAGAVVARAARTARAGRFPLRPVARRVCRPVPGRSRTSGPRKAAGGECRGGDLASRRLFGDRLAREPGADRTVRNSLSRRIALRRPKPGRFEALREEIAALADERSPGARLALKGTGAEAAADQR